MMGVKRLLTKCDVDGLASGVLLREAGVIGEVLLCRPNLEGSPPVTGNDVTAGLPCREDAWLAFDHYQEAAAAKRPNFVIDTGLPSTSRVIWRHFGPDRFRRVPVELMSVADRVTGAELTLDDILYPTGWMLLAHLIDQRTGLERQRNFSLSAGELMERLIDWCREYTIWDVLSFPPLEERIDCYFAAAEAYKLQVLQCATVHNNLVVVDLRGKERVPPGNRFLISALFPECNVSLMALSVAGGRVAITAGKSFLDRSFKLDIGRLMRPLGGGGNRNAGACEVEGERGDAVLRELTLSLRYGIFENLFKGYYNYYYP